MTYSKKHKQALKCEHNIHTHFSLWFTDYHKPSCLRNCKIQKQTFKTACLLTCTETHSHENMCASYRYYLCTSKKTKQNMFPSSTLKHQDTNTPRILPMEWSYLSHRVSDTWTGSTHLRYASPWFKLTRAGPASLSDGLSRLTWETAFIKKYVRTIAWASQSLGHKEACALGKSPFLCCPSEIGNGTAHTALKHQGDLIW